MRVTTRPPAKELVEGVLDADAVASAIRALMSTPSSQHNGAAGLFNLPCWADERTKGPLRVPALGPVGDSVEDLAWLKASVDEE